MEETLARMTEELVYKKTPQEITSLLYQACIEKLEMAIVLIKNKDNVEANCLLQNCYDILHRLGAGINYDAGIVADQLEALYDYMARALIEANLKKDIQKLEEILLLLNIIKDAWNHALVKGVDNQNRTLRKNVLSYDQDYNHHYASVDRKK